MSNKILPSHYVYGPVPSRRLGFSLGIDLTPCKTCSFDCIYCQLGKTTHKTIRRFLAVELAALEKEVKKKVSAAKKIDYITISGSGEPTLHKGLDEIISLLKKATKGKIPVAVITNSSLLSRKSVREELRNADLVVPSLDAASQSAFKKIDKPHEKIKIAKIIEGLSLFRRIFKGKIWLEIMLIKGINTTEKELFYLRQAIEKIKPDKVHLNLPVRPAITKNLMPSQAEQEFARAYLGKVCEVVGNFSRARQKEIFSDLRQEILNYLRRRPASLSDFEYAFGLNRNEIIKYLNPLIKKGLVRQKLKSGQTYFLLSL